MCYNSFMKKKTKKVPAFDVAALQPDELNELKKVVQEYFSKKQSIENEIQLLNDDLNELKEEYSEKLDMKTLNAAAKALKLEQSVQFKDTFDLFLDALKDVF